MITKTLKLNDTLNEIIGHSDNNNITIYACAPTIGVKFDKNEKKGLDTAFTICETC